MDLLICPGCRTASAERIDVRTLTADGDFLVCECGRRYPIVDGVPIVMRDPSEFLRGELTTIVERDLAPELAAALVESGPDDLPYARLLEHLSIYMDAHWGDRAEPAPDVLTGEPWALRPIIERIAALPNVHTALELGCSAGRVLAHVPADVLYGLELQFGALRRARRLLAGERVPYARRMIGRSYAPAVATGLARDVHLACGDALDAPYVPGAFDRVIALNMLDSVAHPRQLLAVVDALCARGGEIILASPYAWQSGVMHEDERFGGADPAGALVALLEAGAGLSAAYQIVDQAELPWMLRRDARSCVTYRTHFVRARKGT